MTAPTRTQLIALLEDMGFVCGDYEDGFNQVPGWAYDLAERIIESGWRKK